MMRLRLSVTAIGPPAALSSAGLLLAGLLLAGLLLAGLLLAGLLLTGGAVARDLPPREPLDPELKRLESLFIKHYLSGNALKGEPYVRALFEQAQRQTPPDRAAYATELMVLSLIAQNRLAEVAPLYEAMLGFLAKRLGPLHPDIPRLHRNMATFLASVGRPDLAEPHYRAATALLRQILGEQDPDFIRVLLEQAVNLEIIGRHKQAEQMYRQSIGVIEQHFGRESELAGMAWERVALFYEARGRRQDAERAWRRSKEVVVKLTGATIVPGSGTPRQPGRLAPPGAATPTGRALPAVPLPKPTPPG